MGVVHHDEVLDILESFNTNLQAVESSLNLANKLLEPGFFKMTTAERLIELRELKDETRGYLADAYYYNRRIKNLGKINMLEKVYNPSEPLRF